VLAFLSQTLRHVYTYTNCMGEEGAPSWPSAEFEIDDGETAAVSGFGTPPAEWGVRSINIYRRASGFTSGREQVEEQVTEWLYAGSIDIADGSFLDTLANMNLGTALETRWMTPPPAGLRGITALPNGTALVGFVGNKLYFSSCNEPWSWPEAQQHVLDDNIMALAAEDGVLHVATDGHPYTVATTTDCNEAACRTITRHAHPLPMSTCRSAQGIIATPLGTFYVSSQGIVWLSGNGQPRMVTDTWFAQDDWRKLHPENIQLGYYAGSLFFTTPERGYVLFLDKGTYQEAPLGRLTTITDTPTQWLTGRNGELFLLQDNMVKQWNTGTSYRPFTWELAGFETPDLEHFSTARVSADGAVDFKLGGSGRPLAQRTSAVDKTFRLPHSGHHTKHSVRLEGVWRVWRLRLATTRHDIVSRR
jgi:hypothetical protein